MGTVRIRGQNPLAEIDGVSTETRIDHEGQLAHYSVV